MSSQFSISEKPTRTLSEFEFLHDPNDKNAKLGIGSFASVKLVREKKTGKLYAIKIMNVAPSKATASDLHNLKTEIMIHKKIDHPNIIKYHGYTHQESFVYLVLDYADNGNLYSYIHKKKQLSENEIFKFFYQTCLAIDYLHKNNIMHRDIKPENLLLDKDYNIKLCDFGWSAQNINDKRLTFCGTYEYMAPEIVNKTPYDYRVDIWSLGVLLYELHHREAPYKGRTLIEITKSLSRKSFHVSSFVNPDAKDLIVRILRINPAERLSIQAILSHPWVSVHVTQGDTKRASNPQQDFNSGKIVQNLQIKTEEDSRPIMKIAPSTMTSHISSISEVNKGSFMQQDDSQSSKNKSLATTTISSNGSRAATSSSKYRTRSQNEAALEEKSPSYLIDTTSPKTIYQSKGKNSSKHQISIKQNEYEPNFKQAIKNPSTRQASVVNLGNLTPRDKENHDFMSFVTQEELIKRNDGSNNRYMINQMNYPGTTAHKYTKTITSEFPYNFQNTDKETIRSNQRSVFDSCHLSPSFKLKLNEIMNQLESKTTIHNNKSDPNYSSNLFTQGTTVTAPVRVQSANYRAVTRIAHGHEYQTESDKGFKQSVENYNINSQHRMKSNGSAFFVTNKHEENQLRRVNSNSFVENANFHVNYCNKPEISQSEVRQTMIEHSTSQKYLSNTENDNYAKIKESIQAGLEFTEFYKGLDLKKM